MKSLSSQTFWDIIEQHAAGRIDTLVAAEILASPRNSLIKFPHPNAKPDLRLLTALITDILRIGFEQQRDTDMRLVVGYNGLWYSGVNGFHLQIAPIVGNLVSAISDDNAIINLRLDGNRWPVIEGMASFWPDGYDDPFQATIETTLEPSRFYADCLRALDQAEAEADENMDP